MCFLQIGAFFFRLELVQANHARPISLCCSTAATYICSTRHSVYRITVCVCVTFGELQKTDKTGRVQKLSLRFSEMIVIFFIFFG